MKKKFTQFRWLVAMLLLVTAMAMPKMAWAQVSTRQPANGDGTAANPYQIKIAEELAWFRDFVNAGHKTACARLEADIDMRTVCHAASNGVAELSWEPISKEDTYWEGTFDGNNKTISNLYIKTSSKYSGLFGEILVLVDVNSSIKDIIFENVNITSTNEFSGVLAGYAKKTDISGITVNSGSINGTHNVGGIVGLSYDTNISNCVNRIPIVGSNNYIGGICGYATDMSITNCANYGDVEGSVNIGGIVGYIVNITLNNVFTSGNVTCGSTNPNCGLVVGYVNEKLTIQGHVLYNSDAKIYFNNAEQTVQAIGKKYTTTTITGESNIVGLNSENLKSGEGAWMLNGQQSTGAWGQQLATDDYPVLGSEYKIIKSAKGDKDANNNDTYWATFSNLNSDATLLVPSARNLNVYNATVSSGTMTLKKRTDNQVAKGEGVLLKTDGEYVNVKANETDGLTVETYANNNLVATSATEETINAETGYKLYRLTYNKVSTMEGLGFYLGLVKHADGTVISDDGSQLKATPGKAYLKVSTEAATTTANAAPARGFVFPGDDDTTGIGEIVIEGDAGISGTANADGRIYNLQGQQVTAPVKGLYIKNNKKVIIK